MKFNGPVSNQLVQVGLFSSCGSLARFPLLRCLCGASPVFKSLVWLDLGIEPGPPAWKADALPLDQTCGLCIYMTGTTTVCTVLCGRCAYLHDRMYYVADLCIYMTGTTTVCTVLCRRTGPSEKYFLTMMSTLKQCLTCCFSPSYSVRKSKLFYFYYQKWS